MNKTELIQQIRRKGSYLCVGLDTDLEKIPPHLLETKDPIFEFNRAIIDATQSLCVAYKPNLAFYEALGRAGWESLEKTIRHIPKTHFIIADAKRGDIGNTSERYARAFFDTLGSDALTIAPYMGEDSVKPFLGRDGKWVIVLALTSNRGAEDFQLTPQENGEPLFEKVMRKCMDWGTPENMMFVVGATRPERFSDIRRIAPNHFLLVPGVGEQGGDLEALSRHGLNKEVGLLVNVSRSIIYAGQGLDFAEKARAQAQTYQQAMQIILAEYDAENS